MRHFLILVFFFLGQSLLFAQQGVQLLQSAEVVGQGGLQSPLQGISNFFSNPAGLAGITHFSAIASGESRYLGTDITSGGAAVAIPTKAGVLGIGISYFGQKAFNEQQVQISFAKKLLDKLSLSVRGYMMNTNIEQYGSGFIVSGDIGLQGYLSKKLTVGFMVINPAQVALDEGSAVPTIFLLGGNYDFSKTFSFGLELEKSLTQDEPSTAIDPNEFLNPSSRINIKGGLVYRPNEKFAFRLGIKSLQPEYAFGMSYSISQKFWIDAVGTYHEILGFSPGVTFRYIGHE